MSGMTSGVFPSRVLKWLGLLLVPLSMLTFWPIIISCILFRAAFAHNQQRIARLSHNPGAATILTQLAAATVSLCAIPLIDRATPISLEPRALLLWIGSSISYALFNRSQIHLRQHQDNGQILIFNEFSNILMIGVGVAVFQEQLTPARIGGAGLILLSSLMLQLQRGKIQFDKHISLNLLAIALLVTGMTLEVLFIRDFNIPIYLAIDWFLQCLFLMSLERISPQQLFQEWQTGPRRHYLLTGFTWSFAIIFALLAYRVGDVSLVTPLRTASLLVSLMGSYIWLGERSRLPQKLAATTLILSGVTLIAQSRS